MEAVDGVNVWQVQVICAEEVHGSSVFLPAHGSRMGSVPPSAVYLGCIWRELQVLWLTGEDSDDQYRSPAEDLSADQSSAG